MEGTATTNNTASGERSESSSQGGQMEKKEYAPVPEGEYGVELLEVADKKTKNGRAVVATFKVNDGSEHDGRRFWHYFNYQNANPKAQEISIEQLDKVLVALGGEGFAALNGNTGLIQDFVGGSLIARVKETEPQSYVNRDGVPSMSKAGNRITSFKAR